MTTNILTSSKTFWDVCGKDSIDGESLLPVPEGSTKFECNIKER